MSSRKAVVCAALALAGAALMPRVAHASWTQQSSMKYARNAFPATVVAANNRVYLFGGRYTASGATTATTEYFNMTSPSFTRSGSMYYSRSYMPAVPLLTGSQPTTKVLLPGGFGAFGSIRNCELFDTSKGSSARTGSLNYGREQYTAVQLATTSGVGAVLAIGGYNGNYNTAWSSCELYNYGAGSWSMTASMKTARFGNTALLLPDGRVMAIGGRTEPGDVSLSSVEYYTPAQGGAAAYWTATDPTTDPAHCLAQARFRHTTTVIGNDGAGYPILLITGGYSGSNSAGQTLSTAELGLYDATTGTYRFQLLCTDADQTTPLQMAFVNAGRMDHTATLVPSSPAGSPQVLVVGGWDGITGGPGTTIALPDVITVSTTTDSNGNTVYVGSVNHLAAPTGFATRHEQTAVTVNLPGGGQGILVCGGLEVDSKGNVCLNDAWVYTP